MKRDNIRFQAQMTFDDDSIRRMFRAEYYTMKLCSGRSVS